MWTPKLADAAPRRVKGHRALDDIKEHIVELRYYKDALWNVAPNGSK
jgi:oligoribonuclease (3'-5' exoribonuclease)